MVDKVHCSIDIHGIEHEMVDSLAKLIRIMLAGFQGCPPNNPTALASCEFGRRLPQVALLQVPHDVLVRPG